MTLASLKREVKNICSTVESRTPELRLMTCSVVAEEQNKIVYAKALHNYKPRAAGELRLHVGDTIKNVTRLNKGWCKVSQLVVMCAAMMGPHCREF